LVTPPQAATKIMEGMVGNSFARSYKNKNEISALSIVQWAIICRTVKVICNNLSKLHISFHSPAILECP
jgi:hypothetical protein